MNSFKIAHFLFHKVEETIKFKLYVAEVVIRFEFNESYGNEYIRLSYSVTPNDNFEKLSKKQQDSMFKGSPDYIFSLSTHAESYTSTENKLLRILEFRHIYDGIMSYVLLQLEQCMPQAVALKVKNPDMWPLASYTESYLNTLLHQNRSLLLYETAKSDSFQWGRLHSLSKRSAALFSQEKKYYSITDLELQTQTGLSLQDIRWLLLHYEVPLKTKGSRIIEKVKIHALRLATALKKELNDGSYVYNTHAYRQILDHLYKYHLQDERKALLDLQRETFLKDLPIQKGDLLQLKDTRIVQVLSVTIDDENVLKFTYVIIKANLEAGKRTRQIRSADIAYMIKKEDFTTYIEATPLRHLDLLHKWVLKKRTKVVLPAFVPDLVRAEQ
ncbi:MAG: hypothetical protein IBJ09_15400 [Bacteroidia bacterium]|nr:hypothetical protein [Bacteroidia bacterium]